MQKKKIAFKKRLDAELRKFSEEDIKKSWTSKTSKNVYLPASLYDEDKGLWYLDKFTALMYLKHEYNSSKRNSPAGNDEEWFDSACKNFFDLSEKKYNEGKIGGSKVSDRAINKENWVVQFDIVSSKQAEVGHAETIILLANYLEEIKDECGETKYHGKYQMFSQKVAPELPQLKLKIESLHKKMSSTVDNMERNGGIAEFVGGAIGIGIVVAIVIGLIVIVMNLGDSSSSSSSGSSTRSGSSNCESKFRSCVASKPESQWYSCQSSYSICLSNSR